jgi:tetratricopeptide (TPR) repeat protein
VETVVAAWKHAQAAAKADLRSRGRSSTSLYRRVASLHDELNQYRASAEQEQLQIAREKRVLRDLDQARLTRKVLSDGSIDETDTAEQYAVAFARYGLEVKEADAEGLAAKISAQRPAVREALIVALDDWQFQKFGVSDTHLRRIAAAADTNAWRKKFRASDEISELRSLSAEAKEQTPNHRSIEYLASLLWANNQHEEAIELLRWARDLDPPDFWICLWLGFRLDRINSPSAVEIEEIVGCYRAALALRPRAIIVHKYLGQSLVKQGKVDLALREVRLATEDDSKREPLTITTSAWGSLPTNSGTRRLPRSVEPMRLTRS